LLLRLDGLVARILLAPRTGDSLLLEKLEANADCVFAERPPAIARLRASPVCIVDCLRGDVDFSAINRLENDATGREVLETEWVLATSKITGEAKLVAR